MPRPQRLRPRQFAPPHIGYSTLHIRPGRVRVHLTAKRRRRSLFPSTTTSPERGAVASHTRIKRSRLHAGCATTIIRGARAAESREVLEVTHTAGVVLPLPVTLRYARAYADRALAGRLVYERSTLLLAAPSLRRVVHLPALRVSASGSRGELGTRRYVSDLVCPGRGRSDTCTDHDC